LRRIWGVAKW